MTVEDPEKAIEKLAPRELEKFRVWYEQFDSARFDAEIERDAQGGKLDAPAAQAAADHRAGRTREL